LGLLQKRLTSILLLALLFASCATIFIPTTGTEAQATTPVTQTQQADVSESLLNLSIPYVDNHYGHADGIIDPTEYAFNYTDPATGITVYLEHNSTVLFVGLQAPTSGWIAFGWKNYTGNYLSDGLNNSDLIYGYAPGVPHSTIERVTSSDQVSVHYQLWVRNGTFIEEGDAPGDDSTTAISAEGLLQAYKDAIIGMRIGEVRHFIIPASEGYTTPSSAMYGQDLEYVITLTRINEDFSNPADADQIVYSYDYGMSTYQHLPYANQSRVLAADGRDDGTTTSLEYYINLNRTGSNGIPLQLSNDSQMTYPLVLMYGANEDISSLPVQHSEWSAPPMARLIPNEEPTIIINSPKENQSLGYVAKISLNITDNSWVRRSFYRLDSENWTEASYNFQTGLWEGSIDLTDYQLGHHTLELNATDPSNVTATKTLDIIVSRPYLPLLGMKLDIKRTFQTQGFHTSEVDDVFTITNNGSAPINAIEFFLPAQYADKLLSMTASDSDGNTLQIVQLDSYQGMYHWRVFMYDSVDYQETYTFTITSHYHSLHTLIDFSTNLYNVSFLKWPVVPYVVNSAQLILGFQSGDTLKTTTPEGTWNHLVPMEEEAFAFEMTSYTPLIVANRQTEIRMDPWGFLNYHETISMSNIGNTKESVFTFTLPTYTTKMTIYDEVGILAASQLKGTWDLNSTVDVSVNLLQDRFGNNAFWPGYKYTFYIDYTVQMSGHSEPSAAGEVLSLPMGTFGNVLIPTHVVDVILPMSMNVISASGHYRLLYGVFDSTLRYTAYNTTVQNPPEISLVYALSISTPLRPVVFSLLIGLVGSVFVLWRRAGFSEDVSGTSEDTASPETRQAGAPPELLSEFAKTYSEKVSLSMELETLKSSRRKGKVTKKEYMIRERNITNQLNEIESELPSLKENLFQYGARYHDLISQLELQDQKIEGAKAGLAQLLLRKKKQRISRAAFEKTRQDYLKTIKKATTATDRILLNFEEEAGEI
jgi:hypothetical protein